ncbi:MAG: helix-turn-helix transcriptional regulator [Proteobacteria bacterium]|nr:helix-turn-helix transcriptional regulator [Pseudomonadota bacterium]
MAQMLSDARARPGFGDLLTRWRKTRRMSQLGLALEAEISSRHVSFIETGRARPSRDMVLRLARALDVPLRERNDLLLAAGFAPVHRETPLDAPEMAPMLAALRIILGRHDPFGAVAMDRNWDIVMASHASSALFNARRLPGVAAIEPLTVTAAPQPNMIRAICHPDGFRPLLVNWAEIVAETLARVEYEAARDPSPKRRALLDEALAYPDVAAARAVSLGGPPPLMIPVVMRGADGGTVELISTIATLGTAEDITLRELRIEAFYPVDPAVEAEVRGGGA